MPETPPETLYNRAASLLDDSEYEKAAKQFEEVERQHPYSEWATRGQLMAAFTHYQALDYDNAIIALDRFIQNHPGHPDIAYAYYLRALSYYERIPDARRDQSMTRDAQKALNDLISRFPETTYARDAVVKLSLVADQLAGSEMAVGRYYQLQGVYTAAVKRFQNVVKNFQQTAHAPEALHRLVECYLTLGLLDEAKAAGAVLGYNFPSSSWYKASFALLEEAKLVSDDAPKGE